MKQTSTPSYVLTLPLRCEKWQIDRLNKVFRVANRLYNSLVADRRRALEQLERTKAWRENTKEIAGLFANKELSEKERKHNLKEWYRSRNWMLSEAGMSDYSFQSRIQKWRRHYCDFIGTSVAQKIATSVWRKFEDCLYRKGNQVRFRKAEDCLSIEGKTNGTNLYYKDGFLFIAKIAKIKLELSQKTLNAYEYHALFYLSEDGTENMRKIKYCRLKRVPRNRGWKYFVQFVMEGYHPIKNNEKGEMLYPIGEDSVGLDIGSQTLAVVSRSDVKLHLLARGAQNLENKLRRIHRAMDRSRRANNPAYFDAATGQVIGKDKLSPELLTKSGQRKWKDSNSYRRLKQRRRALYAKQAVLRKQRHHELANVILSQGNRYIIEDMNFNALAKKAKESKKSEKTGKFQRRKRFGKSIANRSPASFMDILEKKVKEYGGTFHRVSTFQAKATQYNHVTDDYNKKKLSARWDIMPDGTKVQRDLYSAFLLQHIDDTLENYDKESLTVDFTAFLVLHAREIERLKTIDMPSSCGVKKM